MLAGALGLLIFLITVLLVSGGLVLLIYFFSSRQFRRARRLGLLLLAWLAGYAALLIGFSLASQPQTIPAGQERCFDEMCYSVVKTDHLTSLAGQTGDYLLITIQLRSAARRAAQRPSSLEVFLTGANGERIDPLDLNGLPTSGGMLWAEKVPAGSTTTRQASFLLPAGLAGPRLVVYEGFGPMALLVIGDEASWLHARTGFEVK